MDIDRLIADVHNLVDELRGQGHEASANIADQAAQSLKVAGDLKAQTEAAGTTQPDPTTEAQPDQPKEAFPPGHEQTQEGNQP